MNFEQLLCHRRSIYSLNPILPISANELSQLLTTALCQCPTAFNSQSGRIVLLLKQHHHKFWDIVFQELKPLLPQSQINKTQNKISSFSAGYGTILFFDDTLTIKELQNSYPLYSEHFPIWSEQSQGILQFIVWSLLAEHNIGASLQHYNPLINKAIEQVFNIPEQWHLSAQMPFGGISAPADIKTFSNLDERYKILDS